MAERRVPKIGDLVVVSGRRYFEGTVIAIARDKDGEIGKIKVRYRRFGLSWEDWYWGFDLNYVESAGVLSAQEGE